MDIRLIVTESLRSLGQLMRTLSRLQPGETLVVTNLNCVAWSLRQLVELLSSLHDRGIIFQTIERPIQSAEAFDALESPLDTSKPDGLRVLEALRVMLSFTDALAIACDPLAPPAASTTRRLKVMELAAKLKAQQPDVTFAPLSAVCARGMVTSVSAFVESVLSFCAVIDGRTSSPLLEDVVKPVELDLMLEARVVHLAVSLATFDHANQAFRLRTGQLLEEGVSQAERQWPLGLACHAQQRAGDVPLKSGQAVTVQIIK